MSELQLSPLDKLGFLSRTEPRSAGGFIPPGRSEKDWRELTEKEIEGLRRSGCSADDWSNLRVKEDFSPERIRDCRFYGFCHLGSFSASFLEYHDLRLPTGLYNCTIVSCDVGDDSALHNVHYMARTIVGERCLIFNVNELITTDHAKFGNGVVMDGEDEEVRIRLEIANENGGRSILPFDGMLPSDAWIWSKFRDDEKLMSRFTELTDKVHPKKRGGYGYIGKETVIKDCRILKDVKIGENAYIKGCNKLKNLTINSDSRRVTQLGEGCEMVNGIIGYGCRVFYGVKAVRFILNDHSSLKYGARLINAVLGSNSTISCCEVLNSLIFGFHEQHHNSSFLCASVLQGQTNMASAATVGSNHNSRSADGEIVAGRGFWPGLSVSLKHNSRFACFTLIAKGAYPAELDIRLPFSLVSNDENAGELILMPGYWFRYNMYALARNASKTSARDRRLEKHQNLEFDWLAPDTVQEMLEGRRILEAWAEETPLVAPGGFADGRELLEADDNAHFQAGSTYPVENSRRTVRVLHAGRAWKDYGRMIRYWCVRELLDGEGLPETIPVDHRSDELGDWKNVGGQLMTGEDLEELKKGVCEGRLDNWQDVHRAYRNAGAMYEARKQNYAAAILPEVAQNRDRRGLLEEARDTADMILEGIRTSRAKDYSNPFRNITFDSDSERDAVIGSLEENAFIAEATESHRAMRTRLDSVD